MIPTDRKYTKDHEWIRVDDDIVTIGLTDYAQGALGDIVFIELPQVGDDISAGGRLAVIESVKAASDVLSVPSGEVIEVNEALEDAPETINGSPWDAWIAKLRVSSIDEGLLLDADAYEALVRAEEAKK